MTFNELMDIRRYLVSANQRLTALSMKCDIENTDTWIRNGEAWDVVKAYMDAHPELP